MRKARQVKFLQMENLNEKQKAKSYRKLVVMLGVSFIIMYSVMFFNVDDASHIYLSATRTYMTLLMVTPMALMMVLLMRKMYANKRLNAFIVAISAFVFFLSIYCLRRQVLVDDVQYMRGMIPHHSSAIMTSRHAEIKDPELKKLSEQIIRSQQEEIAQMKAILERMKNN